MRIQLRKIREQRSPFRIEKEGLVCCGEFWRTDRQRIGIEGRIEGRTLLTCDRCGETFEKEIEESFTLEASDRPIKVEESLDVVECFDGIVDFDEICASEIAAIRSEYHLCPACGQIEHFEQEF